MLSLHEQINRRISWDELEQIVLAMPLSLFTIASHRGVSEEAGCLHARSLLCDHLRKKIAQAQAPSGLSEVQSANG